jgi:mono/diheme cytochrome c family protein
MALRRGVRTGAAALALAWCAADTGAAAETISPAAMKEADSIYQMRCIGCHGAGGKGDGPMGIALSPKPRDLSDAAWQKAASDAHIEKIILDGGPAVGMSPMMPANSDLADTPDVIKALRAIVRGFGAGK